MIAWTILRLVLGLLPGFALADDLTLPRSCEFSQTEPSLWLRVMQHIPLVCASVTPLLPASQINGLCVMAYVGQCRAMDVVREHSAPIPTQTPTPTSFTGSVDQVSWVLHWLPAMQGTHNSVLSLMQKKIPSRLNQLPYEE